ncbi:RxLR-like protein [Plasmopara halstedii]|uniref:RxLR-like protein n=1 Tax=Plasmopara halstedii TaxID=4781 RepID=A0A0P1AGL4_PLAHL|nr:RxLR-like protein [Plasmopara halstedii]CEG39802.1 RxLR-like protein [Plasmopara halstedii]|eukprot:XP_024576171.1 RxLR-like protein [Plasmopara halstedii]
MRKTFLLVAFVVFAAIAAEISAETKDSKRNVGSELKIDSQRYLKIKPTADIGNEERGAVDKIFGALTEFYKDFVALIKSRAMRQAQRIMAIVNGNSKKSA